MNYDEIFVFLPDRMRILRIEEGTGDNLSKDDILAGYADCLNYEMYSMDNGISEHDSGMILLTELFRDLYQSTVESVKDVLSYIYNSIPEYVILDKSVTDMKRTEHGIFTYSHDRGKCWAECSECGEQYAVKHGDTELFAACHSYCPACGAKMDGCGE